MTSLAAAAVLSEMPRTMPKGGTNNSRTVGDAALDAAGAIGARPHGAALHVEFVVVLAAQHRRAAEAAADLETLLAGGQ